MIVNIQVTPVFKERPDPEGFPACLGCRDPPARQARRETAVSRETGARQEWEWKVLRVLRDLTDCQGLLGLARQDSKVCVDPLGSKVGESEGVVCDGMVFLQLTGVAGVAGPRGHCSHTCDRSKRRRKNKKKKKKEKKVEI